VPASIEIAEDQADATSTYSADRDLASGDLRAARYPKSY
jgi:hypothetical protein